MSVFYAEIYKSVLIPFIREEHCDEEFVKTFFNERKIGTVSHVAFSEPQTRNGLHGKRATVHIEEWCPCEEWPETDYDECDEYGHKNYRSWDPNYYDDLYRSRCNYLLEEVTAGCEYWVLKFAELVKPPTKYAPSTEPHAVQLAKLHYELIDKKHWEPLVQVIRYHMVYIAHIKDDPQDYEPFQNVYAVQELFKVLNCSIHILKWLINTSMPQDCGAILIKTLYKKSIDLYDYLSTNAIYEFQTVVDIVVQTQIEETKEQFETFRQQMLSIMVAPLKSWTKTVPSEVLNIAFEYRYGEDVVHPLDVMDELDAIAVAY